MPGLMRRQLEITNSLGLHLRAASRLAQLAQQFQSEVRICWKGRVADGKSILDLLTLGADSGSILDFEVNGPDSEQAAAALHELVASRFHDDGNGCNYPPMQQYYVAEAERSSDSIA